MYSRKFGASTLPPDYGGSALRTERDETNAAPDAQEYRYQRFERIPVPPESPRSAGFLPDRTEFNQPREPNPPRRPVFRAPIRTIPRDETENNSYNSETDGNNRSGRRLRETARDTGRQEYKEDNERKGLLHGLTSLSKHSFSMEDIVLAGLIILLINEDADSDIIILLALLLVLGL